jgi:2-polyprenyl-3-methyl-5-hydroxy-6-metoxy-1,4-benzoquinol methylase
VGLPHRRDKLPKEKIALIKTKGDGVDTKVHQENIIAASSPNRSAPDAANTSQMPQCPLCGGQKSQVCELFFIHPYPGVDEKHSHVSGYQYKEIEVLDASHSYAEAKHGDVFLEDILRDCSEARSVLDVGCGTGYLLERLAAYSHLRRVGIELNHERAEFARKVAGCEIFEIPVESFDTHEKFDIITLINVFSHIPSLDSLLNGLRRLLNPNGKLLIRTSEMQRGVNKWAQFSWGIPDDIHFLGMGTLDYICRRYDFCINKHVMHPFSEKAFQTNRWLAKGRSPAKNLLKQIAVHTPLAMPLLRQFYKLIAGDKFYLSYIVLTLNL